MASKTTQIIRVAQFGLGAIGLATARLVQSKSSLHLVGAVEINAEQRAHARLGVPVFGSLRELVAKSKPEVILHTTGSRLSAIQAQLEEILRAGVPCISSAEELFHPLASNRRIAEKLNKIAISKGVALLGTGVNPGFVMDLLPVLLSAPCQHIKRMAIRRIVDVSQRRIQLQRKVGVGMSRAEFIRLWRQGEMGHVGLRESAAFVAEAIGMRAAKFSESLRPVMRGPQVIGIHQIIQVKAMNRMALSLELLMACSANDQRDEVVIDGQPPVHLVLKGGIWGDQATSAILVNSIPLVLKSRPGLRSALELGIPRFLP